MLLVVLQSPEQLARYFQFLLGCYRSLVYEGKSEVNNFQFLLGCYDEFLVNFASGATWLSIPFRMLLQIENSEGGKNMPGFQFLLGCYRPG